MESRLFDNAGKEPLFIPRWKIIDQEPTIPRVVKIGSITSYISKAVAPCHEELWHGETSLITC